MHRLAPRRGARGVALATMAAFGCATVREPLPPPPPSPPVARVYFQEPEMELWVEGSSGIDPPESERARTESQAALQAALDGRGVPAAQADAVLLLRERAVARTAGRKRGQTLATVGAVVGIVVVVAVVVVAVAASGGKGGSKSGGKSGGARAPSLGGARATAPAPALRPAGGVAGAAGQAARASPSLSPVHATAPAPPPGAPSPGVRPTAPAPPPGTVLARPVPVPASAPPVNFYLGVDLWTGPTPYPRDLVPPEPAFSVKDRGFFDPDEVLLELALRDARSGEILWGAAVRGWVDPRDREGVSRLVEAALRDQPWAGRPVARAPAPPAG